MIIARLFNVRKTNIRQHSGNMRCSRNNSAGMCCEHINMNSSDMFPSPRADYLWRPAISVDEQQEQSTVRYGEAWRVEAGPDDQPLSLSVCPVTGGNVWRIRQDSSGEPTLSLLMTNLRTVCSAHVGPETRQQPPEQPPTSELSHVYYLISHISQLQH